MTKKDSKIRYLVLILTCLVMIGNYYCFDNPSALKTQLQTRFHELGHGEYEILFNMLYSVYSVPNIVFPFVGGMLVDFAGVRTMLVTFSLVIFVGQMIFALGCSMHHFNLMLVGRFVFGLGGESLGVTQSALLVSWFNANELAFALGINLSIARLGSVINNEISPQVAAAFSVSQALWFGVAVCVMSFVAAIIVIPIDAKADSENSIAEAASIKANSGKRQSFWKEMATYKLAFWLLTGSCLVVYGCILPFNNVAGSLLLERDYFQRPPIDCQRCGLGKYENASCSRITPGCPPVPPYAWPLPLLSANCTIQTSNDQFNCSTTPPYIEDSSIDCDSNAWKNGKFTHEYCTMKFKAEAATATPMSVPYLISAILSPFLGLVVDKIGQRALLALLAPMALVVVHLLLGLSNISPWFPLVIQGISYSVFAAALWPSVPLLVKEYQVGSAYGIITSVQNCGLTVFPMLVAWVYEFDESYIPNVEWLFVGFGVCGMLIGICINFVDSKNGNILNRGMQRKPLNLGSYDATETLL